MTKNLLREVLNSKVRNKLVDFIFDVIASDMNNSRKFENIISYLKDIEVE